MTCIRRPAPDPGPTNLERLRQGVDALVIHGKRLVAAPIEGSELAARAAVAAWLYHSGLARYLVCVEGEINRPCHPAGSAIAAQLLAERYGVPPAAIVARSWTDCTRVEVRGVRVLARARGWRRLAALTGSYHARRVARLYGQIGLDVAVVPCAEQALAALIPPADADLFARWAMPALRASRLPAPKYLEERAKEAALLALVPLDPRGRIERWLARRVRGAASRAMAGELQRP